MRIPFNLALRGQIESCPSAFEMKTRDGKSARVICWDRDDSDFPVVALIDDDKFVHFYTPSGKEAGGERSCDLIVRLRDATDGNDFYRGFKAALELGMKGMDEREPGWTLYVARSGDKVFVADSPLYFAGPDGWRTSGLQSREALVDGLFPVLFPLFGDIPEDGKCHCVEVNVDERG